MSLPDAPGLLYERLAAELAQDIERGVFRRGERLPSVRRLCQTRQVSPATVFQAYAQLEARGLVQARARSGFYVAEPLRQTPQSPLTAAPVPPQAQPLGRAALSYALLQTTRDAEVVPLGSAFPSARLFPFEVLARCGARAMRRLRPEQITGALTAGDAGLRDALRQRYALQGVRLASDELVICNGAMEALNLCLQAVTRPGDIVVVESPTFYGALQALERLGLRALEVATDPREGVDLAALGEILARERVAACWFMPSFQNPLGALMPPARRAELVALLARHGVPLIEDDVYAELHGERSGDLVEGLGLRRAPPAKAFDEAGGVLHCGSFSKCLAPGYRVGLAAPGRFAAAVRQLKTMSSLATSLPAQLALAEYLAQGGYERHLRQLRAALAGQLQRTRRQVARHFPPGTRLSDPAGGYFLWVELPEAVDALALHRRALDEGISSAPGALFSADGRFAHHLRLNTGHPDDPRIDPALRRLGELARELAQAPAAGA